MQTACFQDIYNSNGEFVFASKKSLPVSSPHGSYWQLNNTGRPFIPYCGAILNANGVFVPDTIANNIAFISSFVNMAKECRQASINNVQEVVSDTMIVSDSYAGYLYKKTFSDTVMYQRFLQLYGIVFDFWNNANAAWTNEQYFNALTSLNNKLITEADKSLYIPNGLYTFAAASPFGVNLIAWKAANVNFSGFIGLEYYQ